ncbi:MAG: hypothetical protein KDH19_09315 [Geminicoccaceae bacterium]|nr:hypothetical protein [Geminicoccaceae bacterium]
MHLQLWIAPRIVRNMVPAVWLVVCLVTGLAGTAGAGEASVEAVSAVRNGDGWRFDVTVRHADAGWDHYADKWQVVAPDGTVLGERILLHPHDDEQPFTRSQDGIVLPGDIDHVLVRAHDSVHGWGAGIPFMLPR